jgi:hypothetical protein
VSAPLVLGLELVILYAAGSYAMGRLIGMSGFGGGTGLGRIAFYLLIFPGVVFHESAHYLACLATGTKVLDFAPFSPRRSPDGRLVLGYVRHERRGFPIGAIIGLAPILLNPLGLVGVTALLTPLTLGEVARPSLAALEESILSSGYVAGSPLLAAIWTYLSLSFALGSVPSRKDLSSLPVLLFLFGCGILLIGLFRVDSQQVPSSAIYDLSALAAGLYALPAAVAAAVAVLVGLWERAIRY